MADTIYITGFGIASSLGLGVDDTLKNILQGNSGICQGINHTRTIHKSELPVGEVKYSNQQLCDVLNIKFKKAPSRTALLGMYAAAEAIKNARVNGISPERIAVISSTSVGGMDRTEIYTRARHEKTKLNLHDIAFHDCGASTDAIANYIGASGFCTTLSTACSSAANAFAFGAELIKRNMADVVVAGGTDALAAFTLNGFNTLLILDRKLCRPFDVSRAGLNIGEGAGYVVLESEKAVIAQNKKADFILSGYGNSSDAYHQTASSPEGDGAFLAMSKAIEKANLNPSQISYINAHGTGTPNNDLSEGTALKRIFGENMPPFSSTKSFTGHALAAAGGIEAAISLLAMKNNFLPPNLNFKEAIPELGLCPQTELKRDVQLNHVLSNSFGFGGNNSSIIFSICR